MTWGDDKGEVLDHMEAARRVGMTPQGMRKALARPEVRRLLTEEKQAVRLALTAKTPSRLAYLRDQNKNMNAAVAAARALDQIGETDEARAAGANAVLDVKMRTIPLEAGNSMDFTLVGTAVHVDGLPPSSDPIVATVPALEFVKLLEADVVPTGIAIGAYYEWLLNFSINPNMTWMGNIESHRLSNLWEEVRRNAHQNLRVHSRRQGNGVLAHLNFSQMFEDEVNDQKRYLARHIVVATTVDARRGTPLPHDFNFVVDIHADGTPLTGTAPHHQSYASNESEGAI